MVIKFYLKSRVSREPITVQHVIQWRDYCVSYLVSQNKYIILTSKSLYLIFFLQHMQKETVHKASVKVAFKFLSLVFEKMSIKREQFLTHVSTHSRHLILLRQISS